MSMLKRVFKRASAAEAKAGEVELPVELTAFDRETIEAARPFTMTSIQRLAALIKATRHVVQTNIPGDIVECGVWRGGSMIAAARTLIGEGATSRTLHLFDTFEGMPPPREVDVQIDGRSAAHLLATKDKQSDVWAIAGLEQVREAVFSTGYPAERVKFVKGKVEDTIPGHAPERIAILRLDTDWYESTKHELEHLYDRLVPGGVLIIDDYGHWQGARRAVDEFFAGRKDRPLLNVIDYTGRIGVKP